ncbi:MAG: flagellar FlbD family protein [Candidatus Eremiobacteraeota bacterium]|nr:flagellar FlbD family protein [Candidatus Eremiobacteraeota bacterium]
MARTRRSSSNGRTRRSKPHGPGAQRVRLERPRVISLVRGNGRPVIVNADLIETVERTNEGATVVNLTTGNVLAVNETPEAVLAAVIAYRRSIASRE